MDAKGGCFKIEEFTEEFYVKVNVECKVKLTIILSVPSPKPIIYEDGRIVHIKTCDKKYAVYEESINDGLVTVDIFPKFIKVDKEIQNTLTLKSVVYPYRQLSLGKKLKVAKLIKTVEYNLEMTYNYNSFLQKRGTTYWMLCGPTKPYNLYRSYFREVNSEFGESIAYYDI